MSGVDLGGEVVSRVRRHPGLAPLRCVEWPGGFTWAPLGVTQRIWSEPRIGDGPLAAWRVQVRSSYLTGFDGSPAQLSALAHDLPGCAVAGVVRGSEDETQLQLASTLHVHRGNADRAADLLAFVARWQACEARRLARSSALLSLGALPDLAVDVEAESPEDDDLVERPAATEVVHSEPWAAQAVPRAVELLRSLPGVHAVSTPHGLTASVASADGTVAGRALIEADAAARQPGLGTGLSIVLLPPGRGHVREALALNELELTPGCRTDLLGGWSAHQGLLRYSAFFPDALHGDELLAEMVLTAVRRAAWVGALALPPR